MTLGDPSETRHKEVNQFYHELYRKRVSIYTSDYVLNELITLLFRRVPFREGVRFIEGIQGSAVIKVELVTLTRFTAAWELRKRFQDKPKISFTDLTSMAIMKEVGIQQVLTEDAHFTHVGMGFARVP